jgi:hypothetical protein
VPEFMGYCEIDQKLKPIDTPETPCPECGNAFASFVPLFDFESARALLAGPSPAGGEQPVDQVDEYTSNCPHCQELVTVRITSSGLEILADTGLGAPASEEGEPLARGDGSPADAPGPPGPSPRDAFPQEPHVASDPADPAAGEPSSIPIA